MVAPAWAWDSFGGTSYLFVLAGDCRLQLVGWGTAIAQLLALSTIFLVLDEDTLGSKCDNSTLFKCSNTAVYACFGIFVLFVGAWLAADMVRCMTAFTHVDIRLALLLGIVTVAAEVSCLLYALKEASAGGAQMLILESVTTLLILDLDDKVYEAAEKILGADVLEARVGKREPSAKVSPQEDNRKEAWGQQS